MGGGQLSSRQFHQLACDWQNSDLGVCVRVRACVSLIIIIMLIIGFIDLIEALGL